MLADLYHLRSLHPSSKTSEVIHPRHLLGGANFHRCTATAFPRAVSFSLSTCHNISHNDRVTTHRTLSLHPSHLLLAHFCSANMFLRLTAAEGEHVGRNMCLWLHVWPHLRVRDHPELSLFAVSLSKPMH